AGTVVVRTNDPSFEREIGVRAMAGNYGQRQYAAVLNAPLLDDEVAFRIAVDRQLSESATHGFRSYPGVGDPSEFETNTVRAKLLLQPKSVPGLTNLFTFTHTDHLSPQTDFVGRPFDKRTVPAIYSAMETFKTRTNSGVVDTTWRISDRITLANRMSVADFHVKRTAVAGLGIADIDGKDYSIEPRVRFSDGGTSGFVGAYLFHAKQDETIDFGGPGAFDDKTTTIAAYGEITQ